MVYNNPNQYKKGMLQMKTLLIQTSTTSYNEERYTDADLSVYVTLYHQKEMAKSELAKQAKESYRRGINLYDPEGHPDFEYLSDSNDFAQLHSEDHGTVWELQEILDTTKTIVLLTEGGSSEIFEFQSMDQARKFYETKKETLQSIYPHIVAEEACSFAVEKDERSMGDRGFANLQLFAI